MNFQRKLDKIVKKNNSLVCVGLDPDLDKLPKTLLKKRDPIFEFNKAIVDATADLVCAYKPNIAFYEAEGIAGLRSLKKTVDYIRKQYSEIPIILDAKRGDIGNTNEGYAKFAFEFLEADAITLHPYLGREALEPFLAKRDCGLFILCKTSNEGASEFQDLRFKKEELYKIVARNVSKKWNKYGNCFLVCGATYPDNLARVRKIVGDMAILVPGIGAQGGDVERVVKAGLNSKGQGLIINSSRGIIFASQGTDFAEAARRETIKLKNVINSCRVV